MKTSGKSHESLGFHCSGLVEISLCTKDHPKKAKLAVDFFPAALAEAGLEITFQVGWSVRQGQLSPAGEVETFVHPHRQIWRGR